ncbi:MAG: phosphomannomutase/phosphoglucomutase [Candidatus Berkelbacteria bacterium]|nr:MAG: phosphomannomutase/phosphoglucomutase [Candidatus Berkelbacteria bacterium]QQG51658.1 MAG: phosphomannomutase/phosphoglucomutase [Candidatus Berkelbacteria bacterium]
MEFDRTIFKAYDVRGIYPGQINEAAVKRIAQAYAAFLKPKVVAVGRDVRTSGPVLQKAVIDGLIEAGVNVVDIGVGSTDSLYFAVGYYHYDGGIQVSASHNPAEYNGLKIIAAGAAAISGDTGLKEIQALATGNQDLSGENEGEVHSRDISEDYLDFLATFTDFETLTTLKLVANNNFGATGAFVEKLIDRLGMSEAIELIKLNFEPDGSFPKGRPDPLIPENRAETSQLVINSGADMAVAWDADGDRCYIADENGLFIEGCHLTALLAGHLLQKHPGEKIIYEPRNIWAAEETIKANGGVPVLNKTGHGFIKNRMKSEDALFAGEMSGHFYFRDFFFADNGIIPFLLMLNIIAANPGKKVSEIARTLRDKYFVSGEINFKVTDVPTALAEIEKKYQDGVIDRTDGLSVSFGTWRFNLRSSNTEPLLRLNVEAKDNEQLCSEKSAELRQLIETFAS